jgi:SNF2 family DNA or RNA helicase
MEVVEVMVDTTDINMDLVFKTTPRSYQLTAFDRFKDMKYFALLFDMGLGKTKTAIDIASYKFLKGEIDAVMLIAPNGVHTQWITEQLPEHCGVPYETFIWDSTKLKRKYYKARGNQFFSGTQKERKLKYLAVNVEAFSSKTILRYTDYFTKKFGDKLMIIFDESTKGKNPRALRTKAILRYNTVGCRVILTGTPAAKDPFSLWAQYEFLKSNYFGINYFVFQNRYGMLVNDRNWQTGRSFQRAITEKDFDLVKKKLARAREKRAEEGKGIDNEDYARIAMLSNISEKSVRAIDNATGFIKYKNLDRLKSEIAPITMSVKKDDVADLPPKIYSVTHVLMSTEQAKIYNNLKEQMRAQYEGKELSVQNKLSLTLRLLQVCGGFFPSSLEDEGVRVNEIRRITSATGKLERIKDELEEVDFDETKCIVWAAFVPELLMLYDELSKDYSCCLYYGGVDTHEREKILAEFKEGKYDIFIGNIATAAYGLNLQNATVQLYYSNNFRTEDRLQAENRSHRIGVKASSVVYKDLVIKGTVDELCLASIKMGRDLNDYFKTLSLDDILDVQVPDDTEQDGEYELIGGVMD